MYLLVCLYSYTESRLISILTTILLTKFARMASHQHVHGSVYVCDDKHVGNDTALPCAADDDTHSPPSSVDKE